MLEAFFAWGQKAPSMPAMLRVGKYAIEGLINHGIRIHYLLLFYTYGKNVQILAYKFKINNQKKFPNMAMNLHVHLFDIILKLSIMLKLSSIPDLSICPNKR